MEYSRVGTRGHLFTWAEPYHTNTYVIDGTRHIFVVDTFLGPDPIMKMKIRLAAEGVGGKPFVVFNTHADYDHYWGNQSFEGSLIVAHESALRRINTQGQEGLAENRGQMMGEVHITPPNLLFRKKLNFAEDRVEFFYTPGHTGDSSSCYDPVDRVLLPGDNLEAPYPYVNLLNLKEYAQSLEEYVRLGAKVIVPGHNPPQVDGQLLKKNLDYIRGVASGHINLSSMSQRELRAHYPNTVRLAELYLEKADLNKARMNFNEALRILDLLESSLENDEKRREIDARVKALS